MNKHALHFTSVINSPSYCKKPYNNLTTCALDSEFINYLLHEDTFNKYFGGSWFLCPECKNHPEVVLRILANITL